VAREFLMNSLSKRASLTIVGLAIALTPIFAGGAGEYETGFSDNLWQTAKSIAADSASVFPTTGTIAVQELGAKGAVVLDAVMSIDFYEDTDDDVVYANVDGGLQMAEEVAAFSTGYFDNPFVSGDETWLSATGEVVEISGKESAEYKYRTDDADGSYTGMVYIEKKTGIPLRIDTEMSTTIDDLEIDVVRSLYYGYDGSKLYPETAVLVGTKSQDYGNQTWSRDFIITEEFEGYFIAEEATL
jgi:hypothetical protein